MKNGRERGFKAWSDMPQSKRPIPVQCVESQRVAACRLAVASWNLRELPAGEARMGKVRFSARRLFLAQVENTGTVHGIRGLKSHLDNLWKSNKADRFLVCIGQALASKKSRGRPSGWESVPTWKQIVVEGWVQGVVVNGVALPPLCFIVTEAIARVLRECGIEGVPDNELFTKAISRLGLKKARVGSIKDEDVRLVNRVLLFR